MAKKQKEVGMEIKLKPPSKEVKAYFNDGMIIPKEFKLFGATIKVIFDNDRCDDKDAYGLARYKTNEIFLQDKAHGENIEKTEIQCTFFHEVIHFILSRISEEKLSNNENFVKKFSRALHQVLTTQKF